MKIPEQLQQSTFRFCLLKSRSKVPCELSWQQSKNYSCEDTALLSHLAKGGNYGIVCGIDNIAVVDADSPLIETITREKLPETFSVSTGRGGKHFYFRTNTPIETIPLSQGGENMGHVKSIGSQVVGPNSMHENGKNYLVAEDKPIALIDATELRLTFRDFIKPTLLEITPKREFNIPIEAVISTGAMIRQGVEYFGPHPIHQSKTGKNFWVNPSKNCWHCFRHGTGGYGGLSWLAVQEGIISCEDAKPGALHGQKFIQAIEIAKSKGLIQNNEPAPTTDKPKFEELLQGIELFVDQYQDAFAAVQIKQGKTIIPLKSRDFKRFLMLRLLAQREKITSTEELNNLVLVSEAKAVSSGIQHSLHLRAAVQDGAYWYDLCDKFRRAVKISKGKWEIVEQPPILFRRYSHMREIQVAQEGTAEDLDSLVSLLNLSTEEDKLLLKTYMATALIGNLEHPILDFVGDHGSAKSSGMRALRTILDNSALPLLSMPKDKAELIQQLAHNYMPFYDNLGNLAQSQSDILCRACTGEGFSKRELYTDDDDRLFHYQRCTGLNGICHPGTQPDLLDRSIVLNFKRISKTARLRRQVIDARVHELAPKVLAYLFTVVSKALVILPTIPETNLPRMADFAYYGEACGQAMGYPPGDFLKAYEDNQTEQNAIAIQNSLLGDLLLEFMQTYQNEAWEGTPSLLYNVLDGFAKDNKINTRSKEWPKSPASLSKKLKTLATSLREIGFFVEFSRGSTKKGERKISISRLEFKQEQLSEPSELPVTEAKQTDTTTNSDNTTAVRNLAPVSIFTDVPDASDSSDELK